LEFKFIIWKEKYTLKKIETGLMVKTFWPVFFVTLSLTSFFTMDVILTRHFLTPFESGEYVALSTIGRIIYYAVGPIIAVMFPLISSRISNGTAYILPLLGTLITSLLISTGIMFLFFLFHADVMSFLFGGKYTLASHYLGLFSFFISIYTLNSILTHFLLSISYYKPIIWLFLISASQAVGIFLFHNSISDVIWVNILTSLFYLVIVTTFVVRKEFKTVAVLYRKIRRLQ
jgi:O-antigen/teichoic acid export membrane protein